MSTHLAHKEKDRWWSNTTDLVQDDTIDARQALGFLCAGADELQRQEELSVVPPPLSRFSQLVVS